MDIISIIIGVIGVIIAIVAFILSKIIPNFHELQWWKRHQMKKAYIKSVRYLNNEGENELRFGRIKIPYIRTFYIHPTPATALNYEEIRTEYLNEPRILHPKLKELIKNQIPELKKEALLRGQVFDDNPGYDLLDITSERKIRAGCRIHYPILTFGPTSFYPFAALNMQMDKALIEEDDNIISIRQFTNLDYEKLNEDNLNDIPVPLRLGTNTVVLTSDGLAIMLARSSKQYIEPGQKNFLNLHVVGEGMLRPIDSESHEKKQWPSPFKTVMRALNDELYLKEGDYYEKKDIKCLGFFLDLLRIQPVAIFLVKLNRDFISIQHEARMASDSSEYVTLVPIKFEPKIVRLILEHKFYTTHRGKPEPCIITSNHAQASLMFSLFHEFPYQRIRKSFKE